MSRPCVRLTLFSFAAFSFFHLALFCAYYLISVFTADQVLIYFVYFLADFVSYLLPVTACAGMLSFSQCAGRVPALLYGGALALSRIFYEIPQRTYGLLAEGYDTLHAILLAALISLGVALAYFAVFLLLLLLVSLLFKKRCGKTDARVALTDRAGGAFALDRPLPCAVFSAVLLLFAAGLVRETADTVTFFLGVSGIYSTGEIVYLISRYLFLLLTLVLLQPIGVAYAAKTADALTETTKPAPSGGKDV
ncbi:MAG TPA: hypothetical protein DDY70_01185, partial [Clostridiales bacterium]|nr:hypothetical protein [Clostridiales bacterium]